MEATTAKGNTYTVVPYVDPHPGLKGRDRIYEDCWKCQGTGVVGYGNVTMLLRNREDRWCFVCHGSGKYSILVTTARHNARAAASRATRANAEAADFAADAPAREEAERAAAAEADAREAARIAALPKGFLADPGTRLRDLHATITLIRSYDTANYVTGRPEQKWILAFDVAGKIAVWFTGSSHGLEEGQHVTLTGTVKEHTNHRGTDQTVLTRCTIKEG